MGNRVESFQANGSITNSEGLVGLRSWLPTLSVWLSGIGLAGLVAYGSYEGFRAQSAQYQDKWSGEIVGKLTGKTPLGEAERRYNSVVVTSAAPTYVELLEMQSRGNMINVRDYAGTVLPNGVETNIIGKIAQGEIIYDVILTVGPQPNSLVGGYWGAFKCDFAKGIIWKSVDSNPEKKRICAIYGDYLSEVGR